MKSFTLLALSLLLPASAQARNDCNLELSAPGVSIVWNQNFQFQAVSFTVTKRGRKPCLWGVAFSRGGATDYSARRMLRLATPLRYQLYGDSSLTRVLKDFPEIASPDEAITGTFTQFDDQTASAIYYVSVPLATATTPTYKPSGSYSDIYRMTLYQTDSFTSPGFTDIQGMSSVSISTQIPKLLEISLTASGGGFDSTAVSRTLDFGTLATGQSQSADLQVRTNAGYSLSLSSANAGKLRNVSAAGGTTDTTIPYTLTVGGVSRDLSSGPVTVASGSGQTPTSGVRHAVGVTIGSVTDKAAGAYSDVITVTATSTE